jgi:YVTN family beta-propeller protein
LFARRHRRIFGRMRRRVGCSARPAAAAAVAHAMTEEPTMKRTCFATARLLPLLTALATACDDEGATPRPDAAGADAGPGADTAPAGDGDGGDASAGDGAAAVPHTLFVTAGESLVAVDVASGNPRSGSAIGNVRGAIDMQVTDDGFLFVNLTQNNEVLVVNARTFTEVARVPSSARGATRPVHGFITPRLAGKQYWVASNDGEGTAATSSLTFIDLNPGAGFARPVGELPLGAGHHKVAFSPGKARVSVSNIADCDNVLQVIDYSDAGTPRLVEQWSAAELDPARACTPAMGVAPHGASSAHNGHGFHNLTGWGAIASVDQDADAPTVKLLATKGTGAGDTRTSEDGLYIYSLQRTPREGAGGAACQIGQLAVVDAHGDSLTSEIPILLTPTACNALPTPSAAASPDHTKLSQDGHTLFVTTQAAAAAAGMPATYADQLVVFDLTAGGTPVQKPSIAVGKHTGDRAMAITGDGRWLYVVNSSDKTVSQVNTATLSVTRTITLPDVPGQVASWGTAEGPSAQTGPH